MWNNWHLVIASLVGLAMGVIGGIFLDRYFQKKSVEEAEKKLESLGKEQTKNILSALGKKPKPEDLNRFANRIETEKNLSATPKKKKKKKKK